MMGGNENSQFARHLRYASEAVKSWPKWKQGVLGRMQQEITEVDTPKNLTEDERYAAVLDEATDAMAHWPPAAGRNGRMNVGGLVQEAMAQITRQERVERKLRGALNEIDRLAGVGASDMSLSIQQITEFALDYVPENEDMDRAVEDLPGKESEDAE